MLSNLRQMENFKLETSDAKIVGMCGYFPQFLHGCSPPHSFGLEKILFSWNLNIHCLTAVQPSWTTLVQPNTNSFPLEKNMYFTLFPTKALYVCLLLFCLFFSLFDSSCCRFVVSRFLCKEQVGMVSWAFKMPVCYWDGVRYTIVTQISLALCFLLLGGSF